MWWEIAVASIGAVALARWLARKEKKPVPPKPVAPPAPPAVGSPYRSAGKSDESASPPEPRKPMGVVNYDKPQDECPSCGGTSLTIEPSFCPGADDPDAECRADVEKEHLHQFYTRCKVWWTTRLARDAKRTRPSKPASEGLQ